MTPQKDWPGDAPGGLISRRLPFCAGLGCQIFSPILRRVALFLPLATCEMSAQPPPAPSETAQQNKNRQQKKTSVAGHWANVAGVRGGLEAGPRSHGLTWQEVHGPQHVRHVIGVDDEAAHALVPGLRPLDAGGLGSVRDPCQGQSDDVMPELRLWFLRAICTSRWRRAPAKRLRCNELGRITGKCEQGPCRSGSNCPATPGERVIGRQMQGSEQNRSCSKTTATLRKKGLVF